MSTAHFKVKTWRVKNVIFDVIFIESFFIIPEKAAFLSTALLCVQPFHNLEKYSDIIFFCHNAQHNYMSMWCFNNML